MNSGKKRTPPSKFGSSRGKPEKQNVSDSRRRTTKFRRRLLVVDGLTSACTVEDVSTIIYKKLRVPSTHGRLSLLVRSLRKDVRDKIEKETDGGDVAQAERPTFSRQMLGELGVVLHPESAVATFRENGPVGDPRKTQKRSATAAKITPAFHLRTRIAVKDYNVGGKFYNAFAEDGGYRRETLVEALSKSWSVQIVKWMFNKHWITRLVLITFIITSLVGLAQQVNDALGLQSRLIQ